MIVSPSRAGIASRHVQAGILVNGGLAIAGVLISLFLGDWALGLLGFPSEAPERISHPVNYEI